MPKSSTREYLAECFWPGVREADLQLLDNRVHTIVADLARSGEQIRYLGSLLMRADEVVLCQFEGPEQTVREVAEHAQVPFERILEAARSPWPNAINP